jgi:hypothetical protein
MRAPSVPHVICTRFWRLSNRAARRKRPNRAQFTGLPEEEIISRKKVCAPDRAPGQRAAPEPSLAPLPAAWHRGGNNSPLRCD